MIEFQKIKSHDILYSKRGLLELVMYRTNISSGATLTKIAILNRVNLSDMVTKRLYGDDLNENDNFYEGYQ